MGKLKTLPARLTSLPPVLSYLPSGEQGRTGCGRTEASPWRAWYNTQRWRNLRLAIFKRDRFTCQWPGCGRIDGNTSRLIADHRKAHRGDAALFWDEGNLQTLCKPCHDGPKQRAEMGGRA